MILRFAIIHQNQISWFTSSRGPELIISIGHNGLELLVIALRQKNDPLNTVYPPSEKQILVLLETDIIWFGYSQDQISQS